MLGKIELQEFEGLRTMPQRAASAWTAGTLGIVGAGYKPLLYLGQQITKGVNYWFIAEQKMITAKPERRVVKLAVNEFGGRYQLVGGSVEVIAK